MDTTHRNTPRQHTDRRRDGAWSRLAVAGVLAAIPAGAALAGGSD